MYQSLLNAISKIATDISSSTNFLSLIGQQTQEMTHSAFIASLLDPNGPHNQGTLFLDEFIVSYPALSVIGFDTSSATVEVEKDMGPERVENGKPMGGRIDILLQDSQGVKIAIENKIYASDQDHQLERYWNSIGGKGWVVYLTLDNHMPSSRSLGSLWPSNVICISYRDEIVDWLTKCLVKIDEANLRAIIGQYIDAVRALTKESGIIDILTSSAENMKAALDISRSVDAARDKACCSFMERLQAMFMSESQSEDDCIIVRRLYHDREGWHFHIRINGRTADICTAWRLFIRIMAKEGEQVDNALKDTLCKTVLTDVLEWNKCDKDSDLAWKYVKLNDRLIDFHNFTMPALEYLDQPDKVVKQAYNQIQFIMDNEVSRLMSSK